MSPAELAVHFVDAFVTDRGGGNRAAVVLMDEPASGAWRQAVAADLGAPATTFAERQPDGRWRLRWFSPSVEMKSCGHGTLAAAAVLCDALGLRPPLNFDTELGPVTVDRVADGFRLGFPAQATEPWELPDWAVAALGVEPAEVRRSERHCLVRVASVADVLAASPDLTALSRLPTIGLAVTAAGSGRYDITTRWFVAREGIEDQATGTAHTLVGPYWAERLGRPGLTALQASARGGHLEVVVEADRVLLGGRAITVLTGRLNNLARFEGSEGAQ
ncbi:PhzF family phenazine biosynthesis protein [Dactylosporangium sp. CA-139114]|uniref:PhzF family phenazine biosynthesis protein n=1 Tax=Dactylosporangium sp. CA-139114 TaxID=3239931 RepID=UPI003D95C175